LHTVKILLRKMLSKIHKVCCRY